MNLSAKQQKQVDAALWMETESETLTAIAAMQSPEELHGFMLEYNWDDGLAIPSAVLEHPKCERATALQILYDAQGLWVDPKDTLDNEHDALLSRVRGRLLSGELPEQMIPYDPETAWGLNRVTLHKLRKAGFPEELLRRCGPR